MHSANKKKILLIFLYMYASLYTCLFKYSNICICLFFVCLTAWVCVKIFKIYTFICMCVCTYSSQNFTNKYLSFNRHLYTYAFYFLYSLCSPFRKGAFFLAPTHPFNPKTSNFVLPQLLNSIHSNGMRRILAKTKV